ISNAVPELKQNSELKNLRINLSIAASALAQGSGVEGLNILLDPARTDKIEIKATDIWNVIEAKFKQYPQFFDADTLLHYYADEFDDYKSKALDLQSKIDGIIEANKNKPKDVGK